MICQDSRLSQEWDPSSGTDDVSTPVTMLVNSRELCAADFHLAEVSPLQLDSVVHGGRRTLQGVGNSTFVLSVETTMTSGHDVSEYLGTLGQVKSYFFKFFEIKNKTIEEKKYLGAPTPPEDQVILLFTGLLTNPDMLLNPEWFVTTMVKKGQSSGCSRSSR
jgi:hypothetical protein